MVLQQNARVKLWGWSDPNEKITLHCDWDTTTYTTSGSSNAQWQLEIKTPGAGVGHTIKISGRNNIVLQDVVFGEVWLCSGQSNMEMNINWGLTQYSADTLTATNKEIRFFYIPKMTAAFPQMNVEGKWVVCTPSEMKKFSVAGYFFGKALNDKLHVPIGLINANWGGTPAEVWTPAEVIERDSVLKAAAGKINESKYWPMGPGYAYNAMIYPLTNYSISGVIWYQGESNVGTWYGYHTLFTSMIGAWRKQWQKDFPFYFVQIAPFAGYGKGNAAALLREAQTLSASYPNTGMVLTSDLVDDIKDIHPKLKKEVGTRLANYALRRTYGQGSLVYKSPEYKSMKVEASKIRIYFDNPSSGLMIKGKDLTNFYIAGADKKFLPANAKIQNNTVVVWNKDIKEPVAVRFGFTNSDMPNLYSIEGLPVNIFRTDNWDVDTVTQ
ncbi:MAG: sialate O-acetylesterase [Flavisolibacter sp.]